MNRSLHLKREGFLDVVVAFACAGGRAKTFAFPFAALMVVFCQDLLLSFDWRALIIDF